MLEELFVHLLAHLAVLLGLHLLYLPVVDPIFVVHQILKSVVPHNEVILICHVLSLLALRLVLDLRGRGLRRGEVRVVSLLTRGLREALRLREALLLYVFVLQRMVAV